MSDFPFISIVILNFNGLEYLRETIPPLMNLNYPNYEILIVDNGSKDESIGFLEKSRSQSSKIKIMQNGQNFGYSRGKNLGVKEAIGEYILMLDEDILVSERNILNGLLNEYLRLGKSFNAGFLSVLLKESNSNFTTLYGGFISAFNFYTNKKVAIEKIHGHESFAVASPDGGAVFFRRDFFREIGMFDESQPYYIDVGDIGIRALISGYENFVYCKEYFLHLGQKRRQSMASWCWKYQYCFSGALRILIKNDRLLTLIFRLPLVLIFFVAKTLKQFIIRKNFGVIRSFFYSIFIFFHNLPDTLKERSKIQQSRLVKEDFYLKIRPPQI